MKIAMATGLAAVLCGVLVAQPGPPHGVPYGGMKPSFAGVAYAVTSEAQKLDLFLPESASRHGVADSPEALYLGGRPAELPHLVAKANPITYISPDDPPFLIQKGEKDCMVPVGQSRILLEALSAGGIKAELDILDGAGHGDMGSPVPQFLAAENVTRVVDFVKSVVGR